MKTKIIHHLDNKIKYPKTYRFVCDRNFFNIFSNVKLKVGDLISVYGEIRMIKGFENNNSPVCDRYDYYGKTSKTRFYGTIRTEIHEDNSSLISA